MMETSTTDDISEQLVNIELHVGNDNNLLEHDFPFGNLTVERESFADMPTQSRNTDDVFTIQNYEFQEGIAPTFYDIIPTLQQMSSVVVAVALWRRAIELEYLNHITNSCSALDFIREKGRKQVEESLLSLPVPRAIREIVGKYLELVLNEMNNWFRYYQKNIFTSKRASGEGTANIYDLLFCIWLPNGKIDEKRSAVNMLSNPRLTKVDQFIIMSRYCLEDEIKKIPPKSLPSYFTKRIRFNSNALMCYWLCYVNDEMDKLPKKKDKSIESMVIEAFNVDTWSAIEYFWDRLNVEEQLSKAEELLIRRPQFQKQLFSKMNDSQKCYSLSKKPVTIAVNFWKQEGQERFTFLTWIYIRNFVSYEQFEKLIDVLLSESLVGSDEKISCLADIWTHVPDHLKKQSLQRNMTNMVIRHHTYFNVINPCRNVEFLSTYLSDFSIEMRKKIIFERAEDLVLRIEPSVIDPLIKLCLPNAKDVVDFKKYLLELNSVRDRCCDKLHDNDLHELNEFLDYYCPDSISRSEFCNEFLESFDVRGGPFYYLPKWIETVEFIDNNLRDILPHQAIKFKKRLVWSFALYCCELWSNDREMNKMTEVVSRILDAKEIGEFKTRALERVQTRYRWCNFDQQVINGFLLWCCDDDFERVKEFKKSLSIDGIFLYGFNTMQYNHVLRSQVDRETVFRLFDPMEKVLFWYFEDIEDVKKFKLKMVFGRGDDEVPMLMRYSRMETDAFTRNTLQWFFDGDEEQIGKFIEK